MPTTATKINFVEADTQPQIDPYHRDTQGRTWSKIYIDLETGRYGISQEYDDGATPADEWCGRTQATSLAGHPDAEYAKTYLTGEGAALVQRVLDGAEIVWDGSNHVGRLDDDAQAAWDELVSELTTGEQDETAYWTAQEALEHLSPDELGITADTTDEELAKIAAEYDADPEMVIIDDVATYLRYRRDDLRKERDED